MKNQKGITLVSLMIYVIVMVIVLGVMSSVINKFYGNADNMNVKLDELLQFNKFNIYFLKEVKLLNNEVDTINFENDKKYIIFKSGNSFMYDSNKIYYNNLQICENVKELNLEYGKSIDGDGKEFEDKTKIIVTLNFENFQKTITYKVENIY